MKLAAVTALLKYYPLPAALRTIADAGYQGVELWGGLPHAYTDDFYDGGRLDQACIARARAVLRDYGLEPVAFLPEQCFYPVHYLVTDAPPFEGARLRARSIAYFERAIEVVAALRFPKMVVTTPFWGWQEEGGTWRHAAKTDLAPVVEVLGGLARHAERRDVTLVLEPLTFLETTAVETLDELVAVLDGVASPALAAMLDTGHVNVTARALGDDPTACFAAHVERLSARLQHLHIDDNRGDLDTHLVPGEGTFDFAAAYRTLAQAGYEGFLSAELMMFGANPVPPRPAELLARTRDHTLATLERVGHG